MLTAGKIRSETVPSAAPGLGISDVDGDVEVPRWRVGVPDSVPAAATANPAGGVPDQEYGGVPPDAVQASGCKACPTAASASAVE